MLHLPSGATTHIEFSDCMTHRRCGACAPKPHHHLKLPASYIAKVTSARSLGEHEIIHGVDNTLRERIADLCGGIEAIFDAVNTVFLHGGVCSNPNREWLLRSVLCIAVDRCPQVNRIRSLLAIFMRDDPNNGDCQTLFHRYHVAITDLSHTHVVEHPSET